METRFTLHYGTAELGLKNEGGPLHPSRESMQIYLPSLLAVDDPLSGAKDLIW